MVIRMDIIFKRTLDKDRAFDTASLNELLTQGRGILNAAIDISKKMEDSIGTISSIYSEIDSTHKLRELSDDITSLSGTLDKECYHNTIRSMKEILDNLINNIPSHDTSLAQSMDGIVEVLDSINGRIGDLRSLFETGDVDLSYEEFGSRISEIRAGWDETTQDLAEILAQIESDMLGVYLEATPYSTDPVNLSTGNFVYDHEDMKIKGEIPLSFHRYYNSKARGKGSLGRCFVHNYDSYIENNEEKKKATITMGDGQKKTFRAGKDGTYTGLHSAMEILTREGETFVLTELSGARTVYDKEGHMTRKENLGGRGITFSYDEEGKLKKAETDNKAYLEYGYDEEGMLVKVTDHTGRMTELSYAKGKLAGVKTPSGSSYAYSYAGNGRLEETVNPRGYTSVKNTYDDKHRVTRQEFPDGGHMEYAYDDNKRQVILTERNGSKTTYVHDSKYRCTDIIYEDGTKERFGYNGKNRRVLHVDRNGNATRYAYDGMGNLTQVINALGEKTNLTYNAKNKLITLKVNGKEKLRNSYDEKGNLIFSTGADGSGNSITYDTQGRPVCIENADKSITNISYDAAGNITNIKDAGGMDMTYKYDSLNRVICTVDGNGHATSYEYDNTDKISRVINPLGDSRSYSYNESGKVTKVTDYDGYAVRFIYNNLNKPRTVIDKEGNETCLDYDSMWNVSGLQQANGGKYRYEYDADNRLKERYFPEGGCISYAYDGNGNCVSETDAEGNNTSYAYDALNRIIKIIDAKGAENCYNYDNEGNLVCITDAMGNRTVYTYDEMGRRVSETDALGNKTAFEYTLTGNIEKITYPNGTAERYVYQNGILKSIYKADGSSQQYKYDGNGNIISVKDGAGKETGYVYDALNRVIAKITKEGKQAFQYDSVGNLKQFTDENGNITNYEYSPNGNLKKVTDALGNETCYDYDCMGNLIKIERTGENQDSIENDATAKNKGSQITMYERNLAGQIIKATDQAGSVEHYTYDKNGRMAEKLDRENLCTRFGYAPTGELTKILYADGRSVMLSYDALNHLETVKDWNGTTKIITDALGRTLSVTEPDGRMVSYEWGNGNEKKALTYPNGQKAEYSYNSKGLLENLITEKGKIGYKYDEIGRLIEKEFPNGTVTSYTYNDMGRICQICHQGEAFSEICNYQYDAVGNKILIEKKRNGTETDNGSFGYAYDALNRLTQVTENGRLLREYGYDAYGNRTVKKEYEDKTERTIRYRYNEKNQLISEVDNGLEKTYSYDLRGNMTGVSLGGKMIKQFAFDAANRMSNSSEIAGSLIKKAEYRYNGLGQRIGQDIRENGKEKKIHYTIDLTRQYHNLLMSNDSESQKEQTFYWDGNVAAMQEAGHDSYYMQDDLGSPMLFTDEEGEIREKYGYDEFGQSLFNYPEGQMQPFGFTGYQMDEAGGLYFAQARRYDAEAGRFVSEDFIKGFIEAPFTLNNYGYCWNRPLDLVDLDGLMPEGAKTALKIVGAVVIVAGIVAVASVAVPAIVTATATTASAAAAATEITATVVTTEIVAGAVIGGVSGGVTNKITGSGSFVNGFFGGAIDGAVSVVGGLIGMQYTFNAAGGAIGSVITDELNNSDKPKEEQKSDRAIIVSAFAAGATQSVICGGMLYDIWKNGTGGWNIAGTNGVNRIATILWEGISAVGVSFTTGAISAIVTNEVIESVQRDTGLDDDNSVKE